MVHATGVVYETVRNHDPAPGAGTGFAFDEYSPQTLLSTLLGALTVRADNSVRRRMQFARTREDFSWDASAREYVTMYGGARP